MYWAKKEAMRHGRSSINKACLIGRREAVSSEADTANGISQLAVTYLPAKRSRQRVCVIFKKKIDPPVRRWDKVYTVLYDAQA